ncbi:Flp pilus assembly protein CpaB [Blastochloris sulfoviridis]|uniref:Flp pilus assembly protein CpaB n=1 Tax=Blastochloris sulfoviridis TaxID=50712 RepID=A0A5M6I6D1_9HYPH|nr:Flp pilus assembly protein CpaB [Blastochloris sulfoviridis]KAA5603417.1 Flp pilus assembly protein CpaB [Blastochloris sulfoviridis]
MKSARVVVLLIALGAGGVAALLATRSKAPAPVAAPVKTIDTVEVLIAHADIGTGNVVKPADIAWEAWPAAAAGAHFITRAQKPNAPEVLAGAIARTPFLKGEPIRESKLIKADGSGFMAAMLPAGMRAISVEISPETGAAGFILPNDRVDVILTKKGGGDRNESQAETVLTNVRVLAIDQTIEEKNGEKVVVGKTATLELSGRQTEILAQARQSGHLSLALRSLADANDQEPVRTGVTIVRFGAASTAPR